MTEIMAGHMTLALGLALAFVTVTPYVWYGRMRSSRARRRIEEAERLGLREPVTIHPKVDTSICIGCGGCANACPEHEILALVDGKSTPVYTSRCVGHGACERACPVGAIRLVFGSEKRGVDIPQVYPNFETNVEGVFIAGELGGMGLIRNAVVQGIEAVENIADSLKREGAAHGEAAADLVIVGCGPAGLAASLQAKKLGLRYITIEQEEEPGGAIHSYPRAKVVMTSPVTIPLYGRLKIREVSKERLLDLWRDIIDKTGAAVETGEKVLSAVKQGGVFEITTSKRTLKSRRLLLAIGRRGTPRKLGIPGERLPKVMYRLLDPEAYAGQAALVTGGGDSAVETAMALSEQAGTRVTLSYRGSSFTRIKARNKERLDEAAGRGGIEILLESQVKLIGEKTVTLSYRGRDVRIANDSVFVLIGGESPNDFLKKTGVNVETRFGAD